MVKNHLDVLTWLRAIAAMLVIVTHVKSATYVAYSTNDEPSYSFAISLLDLGAFAVYLFFALSGCTLFISNSQNLKSLSSFGDFFIKRFMRIWPLFAISLLSPRNDAITNAYRVLLLGHFKYKPVILQFSFAEMKSDLDYIRKKYKLHLPLTKSDISRTQKSRFYESMLNFSGFEYFDEDKHQLTAFVSRVANQIAEPREVFDSCIKPG